jgi:lipoate-protein ligase A
METWRLLDTSPRPAAENMALDEVVLTARSRGVVPNTLRFLQFSPHCTLVGYHQAVDQEIRLSYCQEHGVEVNRRLTGGGGLYWDESQLGWEICASQDDPRFPHRAEALYERICQAAIYGLEKLGVHASFRPKNDIEVEGRKISGTGGTRLDGAFLFQGTLLVDFDVDTMLRALRIPTEKLKDKEIESVRERVTCLAWELGIVPPLDEIKAALAAGFAEVFGAQLAPGPLTAFEEHLLAERLPYFQSDEWVYGVRRPLTQRDELRALYKSPGGLIRVSLVVNAQARRIREAFITGDFFAYPRRAILDLEARLKGVPAHVGAVHAVVERFFAEEEIEIPGVTAEDMLHALHDALDKSTYVQYGIPLDRVNDVFTVVKALPEITSCDTLLLPYCAKLADCEYRFQDGCAQCGLCGIGEAYELAAKYGLRPVSIQSYEDLEETLGRLKDEGTVAFVGSCCEPFYAKHRDDFERIGLPGILVDVDSSTCYDLGREQDAYVGRFENQTYLRLDLLERVVARVAPSQSLRQSWMARSPALRQAAPMGEEEWGRGA